MTDQSHARTADLSIAMFTVADQDAALAFYTEKLGFEVRGDTRFGENNEWRWLEVAPPGSHARLALNPPMGGEPLGVGVRCWLSPAGGESCAACRVKLGEGR